MQWANFAQNVTFDVNRLTLGLVIRTLVAFIALRAFRLMETALNWGFSRHVIHTVFY